MNKRVKTLTKSLKTLDKPFLTVQFCDGSKNQKPPVLLQSAQLNIRWTRRIRTCILCSPFRRGGRSCCAFAMLIMGLGTWVCAMFNDSGESSQAIWWYICPSHHLLPEIHILKEPSH